MKVVFLIIAVITFTFTSAQYSIDTFWVNPNQLKPKTNPSELPKINMSDPSQQLIANSKLLHTLPNGNKVYALPQDNMPCVVPDISQYNTPIAKPVIPNTIPNPAFPSPDKPGVITQDQLKKLLEKYQKKN